MGLDPISGKDYKHAAQYAQQSAVVAQDAVANINITEVSSEIKTNTGNQTENQTKNQTKNQTMNQDTAVSGKQIKDAINQANSMLKEHRTRCEFSYYEDTNRIFIRVIDKDTDKVIKEIPSEDLLKAMDKIWELAGILVDEKR